MEKRKVLIDFELWRITYDAQHEYSEITVAQLVDMYLKSINTEEKIQDKESNICQYNRNGKCFQYNNAESDCINILHGKCKYYGIDR